jgi:hypothetical protein
MFIFHLLVRTLRVEADLVDQLFNSSEKRLARALLLFANFGKEGGPETVIAKVSQETLAEMIGTTRSRVSYFMNKFRQNGYCERLIGSIRRECLDHILVFGEWHLRGLLRAYADYYNCTRTHLSLDKDSPAPRAIESFGRVCPMPILGGLHHRYGRI